MISLPDRQNAVVLIDEAVARGARRKVACRELGLTLRTLERWVREDAVQEDGRPRAVRPKPAQALSVEERAQVLTLANSPRFASLPPTQIVPRLADEGTYLASESTFYRILRAGKQLAHRGRACAPQARTIPRHCATGPNQLYAWDITYLPGPLAGMFFFLYLILDVYSRKVVAHEVHTEEGSDHAATLIEQAVHREGAAGQMLVIHQDNGSPMKGSTYLAKLHDLNITPSYSRPGVSNGRVGDWRGAHTSRGVAVCRQSRCLNPLHVSRFQSPLVEPDVQISRIRLSRMGLRPSLSPRRPGCRGACRGRASRRDTRMDTGGTQWCLASLVAGPSIAADGSRCTSGSPGMRG